MTRCFVVILFVLLSIDCQGQLSSKDIIDRSINYHDPKSLFASNAFTLNLSETRPNGPDRSTEFYLNQESSHYIIASSRNDQEIVMSKTDPGLAFLIDGRSEITEEEREKYRLNPDRSEFMKNYYRYLWMAPLVLLDSGTIIHDKVDRTEFFGKDAYQIKVTYDPAVGEDIWYFYFDPTTFAMVGYRFYHDESKNDGEYILIQDELEHNGIRLPQVRKWYTHKEDKFLGTDKLISLRIH